MKVIIPLRLPCLNDFIKAANKNRYAGANLKKEWQNAVAMALKGQINRPLVEPVRLHYLWVEPNERRDKDNVSGFGHKIVQDALVQIGALKNDGWANVLGSSDDYAIDKENPRVEIEIEEST